MSNMYVNFPNTNPIIFQRESDYDHIQDAERIQGRACFFQQFAETDRIVFQFAWKGKTPWRIRLDAIVDGITQNVHSYLDMDYTAPTASGGNFPASFWKKYNSTNGVYVFSMQLKEIKRTLNGVTSRIINDGNYFKFKLTVDYQEFYSNEIICNNDTDNTKLIRYNNKYPDHSFDTDFTFNPQGYDLRVPCVFSIVEQKANSEMFQTSEAFTEIVSATPYETIKLQIGQRGVGFPDWFVRNLNTIFYLDDKYIDGVAYELEEGTSVEVETISMYNNRFVTVELVRKEPQLWRDVTGAVITNPTIGIVEYRTEQTGTLLKNGTLSVLTDKSFYIQGTNNSFLDYDFSRIISSGNTSLEFSTPVNTTNKTIMTTVNIISRETNEILETVVLENKPITTGVCHWTVCDTFSVRC